MLKAFLTFTLLVLPFLMPSKALAQAAEQEFEIEATQNQIDDLEAEKGESEKEARDAKQNQKDAEGRLSEVQRRKNKTELNAKMTIQNEVKKRKAAEAAKVAADVESARLEKVILKLNKDVEDTTLKTQAATGKRDESRQNLEAVKSRKVEADNRKRDALKLKADTDAEIAQLKKDTKKELAAVAAAETGAKKAEVLADKTIEWAKAEREKTQKVLAALEARKIKAEARKNRAVERRNKAKDAGDAAKAQRKSSLGQ